MHRQIILISLFIGILIGQEPGISIEKAHNSISYLNGHKTENKKSEVRDSWFAIDKIQHFSYSCLIAFGCQYILVNKLNNTEENSLPVSSALSFGAGLLKELNDLKGKNGYFSLKDMVANSAGILVAAMIIKQ
ncbi:MAG: hypothetical protein CMG06_01395 [Candidatus Marinimicrobia bacterium]|nr:hypothetical protein [Candidatus Neomarinimicrobiota bacterium]|tara:strand:+ start:1117 stop:1515 length:399 start_codon:yes stop_codon:yes gene_type:complete